VRSNREARAGSYPVAAVAALVAGLLALAGCGGSSKSSSATTPATPASPTPATTGTTSSTPAATGGTSGGQTLKVAADPGGQLKYDTSSLTAKSGTVTIDFTNAAPLGHNLTIASSSGAVQAATPTFQGGSKTLSLSLKPGTYTFYCSVPGHRAAGMEGKLTVQ
jgi:plastocyanin